MRRLGGSIVTARMAGRDGACRSQKGSRIHSTTLGVAGRLDPGEFCSGGGELGSSELFDSLAFQVSVHRDLIFGHEEGALVELATEQGYAVERYGPRSASAQWPCRGGHHDALRMASTQQEGQRNGV